MQYDSARVGKHLPTNLKNNIQHLSPARICVPSFFFGLTEELSGPILEEEHETILVERAACERRENHVIIAESCVRRRQLFMSVRLSVNHSTQTTSNHPGLVLMSALSCTLHLSQQSYGALESWCCVYWYIARGVQCSAQRWGCFGCCDVDAIRPNVCTNVHQLFGCCQSFAEKTFP